ncbi:MAG: hypothetical protein ACI9YT_000271 [Halobacteriales archaeon]|jgi:hypothetical protein
MLEENVGGTDRLLRLGLGAIALFLGVGTVTLLLRPVAGGVLVVLGGVLLGTALARRCPINRLRDVDTSRRD